MLLTCTFWHVFWYLFVYSNLMEDWISSPLSGQQLLKQRISLIESKSMNSWSRQFAFNAFKLNTIFKKKLFYWKKTLLTPSSFQKKLYYEMWNIYYGMTKKCMSEKCWEIKKIKKIKNDKVLVLYGTVGSILYSSISLT